MKQSALLEHMRRDVLRFLADDRKAREHGVAMVPVRIDRVLAVRDLTPHRVGDEFVLRLAGPFDVAISVSLVRAEHLLKKQDVGRQPVQALFHLVDDHPPGEVRETLVNVVGRDGKSHR